MVGRSHGAGTGLSARHQNEAKLRQQPRCTERSRCDPYWANLEDVVNQSRGWCSESEA